MSRNRVSPAVPDDWSSEAVDLYRELIRARLAGERCSNCAGKLDAATLVRTQTSVGLLLNEYQLGDRAAARLLAQTDGLVVECPRCHERTDVPASSTATS
jgi:hypothetical protein